MTQTKSPASGDNLAENCNLEIHNFSDRINDSEISFHVLKLKDSLFIWVGTAPFKFCSLAMAMQTKYDSSSGVQIMGDFTDPTSQSLAQKIAKKTAKQVFASFNFQSDLMQLPLIEKIILQEMANHPDSF